MGQQFRAARERKGMNLSRAAALTHIKVQNLELMENDDFSTMPAVAYAKGFIRIYANFLGLDPEPLVQEYVDKYQNAPPEARPSRRPAPAAPQRTGNSRPKHLLPPDPHGRSNETPTAEATPEPKPRRTDRTGNRARPQPSLATILPLLQRWGQAALPHLPRVIVGLVLVTGIVLIGRCAAGTSSGNADDIPAASRMNSDAIMKEPPVHYLDLPQEESVP